VRKLWRWVLCRISYCPYSFYHDPEVVETYDQYTRKLRCVHCGQYFAMSDRHGAVLPWDCDYERIVCDAYGLTRTKL
jgi:hypothetical protein